jgi:isopenicillin-N epimerase
MTKRKVKIPAPSPLHRHWGLAHEMVFLNHGSFGACPKPILQLQARLRLEMEAEPIQFLWRRYEERLEPARAELARFVGARPQDLVFVTNATTGINAVVRSLNLRRGDELLATNQDYNACHNVLVEAVRDAGAKLVVARAPFPVRSADDLVEAVVSAVTARTRLAMIDHVTSDTALVWPVGRIIRQLESRGVDVLIDGAHAPGMLPLNLARLKPAYYTGNLHKWVCAPKGAAFLWAREEKQALLQPPVISHGNNRSRPGYTRFQDRFDWAGTFDPTAWFCVGAAIQWLERLLPGGWTELQAHNHDLAVQARRSLCEQLGVEPPCPESMLGSLATIPLPERYQAIPPSGKIDPDQIRLHDEFRIEVPFSRIGQPPRRFFRISAQAYNSLAQYEYLGKVLQDGP